MFCVLCDFVSSVRALRANNCSLMLPGTDVRCGREQKKSTESVCGNFVICWGKRVLLELAWARADVGFLIERCQQIMLSNRLILSAGLRFILFNQVLTECSSANRYDCIQFKCNRGRNLYPQQCYTFPCSCCKLKLVEYNIFVFLGTV